MVTLRDKKELIKLMDKHELEFMEDLSNFLLKKVNDGDL